jgi:alpha-glucosidase
MNNKILVWNSNVKMTIISRKSYKELVARISDYNGYTPVVPKWVNAGAIVGLQGGTTEVIKKYQLLKDAGTRITGLWIQDWVGKRISRGFSRLWWTW